MSDNVQLMKAMLAELEETFERSGMLYLDPGTSLFETLATVTAEEASRPVSTNCATIAAHIEHLTMSIDYSLKLMRGERPQADWTEIWRTVSTVTSAEWEDSQQRLREMVGQLRTFIENLEVWEGNINMIFAALMHSAYHLGEIRHALCTVKTTG